MFLSNSEQNQQPASFVNEEVPEHNAPQVPVFMHARVTYFRKFKFKFGKIREGRVWIWFTTQATSMHLFLFSLIGSHTHLNAF